MKRILHALLGLFLFSSISLQALEISSELLNWANKNPVATVGIEDNFPPFDYLDEDGRPTGVGELIRQQISDILPIDIQVVSKGSFATQLNKLAEKQIAMISICTATPERSKTMLFSTPFLTLTPIVVVHKDSKFQSVEEIPSNARVAVPVGYASVESALRLVNEDNIEAVNSTLIGIEMVNSGKVDGFVTYLSAKSYFIQKHGFANLRALPVTGVNPTPLGFCIDKNLPELAALIDIAIKELGEGYFEQLQAEWIASLKDTDIKSTQDTLSLQKTVALSITMLVLLVFLIQRYAQLLAQKFETLKFKVSYFSVLAAALLSILWALDAHFESFQLRIIENQKANFDITKEVTIKSLDDWYLPRLKVIQEITRASLFEFNVSELVKAYKNKNEALYLQQRSWLSAFFLIRPETTNKEREYKLLMRDGTVLLSSDAEEKGPSDILRFYPKLFNRALTGEAVFIPTIKKGEKGAPKVHIVEPIIGEAGEVVAILAIAFDAKKAFSSLFNDVRLGLTVESYGINQQGFLLSESRFINQLHKDKTVPFGQSAILQLSVAANSPIAHDAMFKTAGRNLTGYQDYMGHTVVGQWSWIDKYDFMLVSELSVDEMYFEYTELRNILFIAFVVSVSVIIATSLFMMLISHRANKINRLSQENLEELVTQRTQDLLTSEEKNSLIVSSVADGILGLDAQGRIVFFNSAAEHLLGYKESDVLLQNYQDVIYFCNSIRPDKEQLKEQINNSLANGESLHVEKDYFCHIEAFEIPVSYSLSVIADENSPFKAVITFQDISQRILETERTKELLESLPIAIFILNMDKKVVEINAATEELLGFQKSEIIGKELVEFIPANRQQEHIGIMQRFFADPKYVRMGNERNVTVQKKSGKIIEVEAIFSVMELNGEQMVVLSALDITEANQTKTLLVEAKELADDASRSKSDFLANMSHEIRTPMNAIIGMSMLALQGSLANKERNYVTKVHSAASNLLGIINDILDFSKIEAGKLELENQTFALADMLDNFSTIVGLKTQEKGVELLFNIAPDVPLFFRGDLLRLNQILINLGGNAIKFTEQGSIILKVSISEIDGDRMKLLFSIKDTGVGIKPEQLKKLFSAFSQADASTTRKYGGTGLGLSISKRLVDLMDGDIWAESSDGEGSEFFFTTWLKVDNKEKSTRILETALVRLTGKRIIIVDDSVMTLATLKEVAESFGCEVFTAQSGKEALQICEKVTHFDFALIDWDMPEMNGLETCDELQKLPNVVIEHLILISAYGREQIREEDYIDRVDSLLAKPVTAQRLHQALQSSLGYELPIEHQIDGKENGEKITLAGAKLLLVEDNELNQELATALLQAEGVAVSHAANGEIAVSMVQNDSYDGILMDIQMPVMDGYKATKLIREFNLQIPIIAMTANAMAGEKEKVIAKGMNDYISKPIDVAKMFSVISKWVKVEGNEVALPVTTESSSVPLVDGMFAHFSKIDQQAGLATCNQNSDLYLKILTRFESANKQFSNSFSEQYQAGSWQDLTRLVHSLKGGAGNIGANTLYAILNDLELACLAPEHNIDIQALFDKSINEFNGVIEEITIMLALLADQPEQQLEEVVSLTDSEINVKLNDLQKLVDEFDTGAQEVAIALSNSLFDPKVKSLLARFIDQLEGFDFDTANETLGQIKNKLLEQE